MQFSRRSNRDFSDKQMVTNLRTSVTIVHTVYDLTITLSGVKTSMIASSRENSLIMAFDELIDSWPSVASFSEQAARVAEFIRLYVQNLFHLDATQFWDVIKKHNQLHFRAAGYQRRGKNPIELLRIQMQQPDDLGRILRRYALHLGAIDCMLDVRATAALAHHMLCLKPASGLPARVVGCEFGAGLGILSIAGSIPLLHRGCIVSLHTFEQAAEPREDAARMAAILKRGSRHAARFEFHCHQGDIVSPEPYRIVCGAETTSGPLALWISETFGYQSRRPVVLEDEGSISFVIPTGVSIYDQELEKRYDPLPFVLEQSCRHFSSFFRRIRQAEIIAFPDIVTPQVIIDGTESVLHAPDGHWRKLYEIGAPYTMLPPSGQSRWSLVDRKKGDKPKRRSFASSAKKRRKRRQ